ncbi:hypothetical protein LIER_19523 [Lithospermum erythrorhizon]|uniref:Uncharacterized protein n=1 Tax=Lithospermum erythrorhizon TaxID=34254 RepID=A0AAV3QL28_LITER
MTQACSLNGIARWKEFRNQILNRLPNQYVTAAREHISQIGCSSIVSGFSLLPSNQTEVLAPLEVETVAIKAIHLEVMVVSYFSIDFQINDLHQMISDAFNLEPNTFKLTQILFI